MLIKRSGSLSNAQLEDLSRVVPFVYSVGDVEAFVALESDQIGVECSRHRRSQRCLPYTGLPFQEQGPAEPECQKNGNRQAVVSHVVLRGESPLQVGNRNRGKWRSLAGGA